MPSGVHSSESFDTFSPESYPTGEALVTPRSPKFCNFFKFLRMKNRNGSCHPFGWGGAKLWRLYFSGCSLRLAVFYDRSKTADIY